MKFGNVNIGGMSLGSTKIGGAKYGNILVYQQGSGPQPVMVPYIRCAGDGSYINTGITPDNTTKIIIWARNWNPGSGWLFGSRISNTQSGFGAWTGSKSYAGSIQVNFNTHAIINDKFAYLSHYNKYELSSDGFKVNDEVIHQVDSSAVFSNTFNLCIFGMNTEGTITPSTGIIDICACQIYKGGVLVRDFTAVNSPSVGLYDAVSQTLFTNAGSGSLTFGEFNEDAYVPLEYIECSGAQYFDSGVYGTYSLPITSKLRSTNTTKYWMGYMGVFSSSPASCCAFTFGNQNTRNAQLSFRLGASTSDIRIFIGSSTNTLTDKDIVVVKENNVGYTYYNNSQIGTGTRSGVDASFSTNITMYIGATRSGESSVIDDPFIGRIYYNGLGAQRSFVPAKIGSRVGMYDTYNDVFYTSITSTPFIAGPTL